jgi:hypothetical protein
MTASPMAKIWEMMVFLHRDTVAKGSTRRSRPWWRLMEIYQISLWCIQSVNIICL